MNELAVGTRVMHPVYGEGIIARSHLTIYEIFFERGGKSEMSKYNPDLEVVETPETEPRTGLSLEEIEEVITFVMDKYQGITHVEVIRISFPKVQMLHSTIGQLHAFHSCV